MASSVDEVNRRADLDFNNLLDDTVEDDIEDGVDVMWQPKTFVMGPL